MQQGGRAAYAHIGTAHTAQCEIKPEYTENEQTAVALIAGRREGCPRCSSSRDSSLVLTWDQVEKYLAYIQESLAGEQSCGSEVGDILEVSISRRICRLYGGREACVLCLSA